MVLATLTASITWTAALNPPGGFWQDDDAAKGYVAGSSVFRAKNRGTYTLFAFFNTASFMSSLSLLVLLSINWLFRRTNLVVFSVLVSVDLVAMLLTFLLGSSVTVKPHLVDTVIIIASALVLIIFLALQIMRRPRE